MEVNVLSPWLVFDGLGVFLWFGKVSEASGRLQVLRDQIFEDVGGHLLYPGGSWGDFSSTCKRFGRCSGCSWSWGPFGFDLGSQIEMNNGNADFVSPAWEHGFFHGFWMVWG